MKETGGHIISKFRWDTSFDQKDRVFELQERLSGWSKINMQKELAEVFDSMCPSGQTWRIGLLELDLGPVDLSDMEFELSGKLKQQLAEKLRELIIMAGTGKQGGIEIVDEDASLLSILRSFLLEGILPWNYKAVNGSVNSMFMQQLQENKLQFIAMLRETGSRHEHVRRRIAWQISDPGIHRIIQGLEPDNHPQILELSSELLKIQSRETIVQGSTGDLKKNLWHWILNYLLTERGTIFNRVSFMRSNIRQMAAHYNVSYDELIALIARAVENMRDASSVKAGFVLTLKAVSASADVPGIKQGIPAETGSSMPSIELSKTKTTRFAESLYFLEQLGRKTGLLMSRDLLWEIAGEFLSPGKNSSIDRKAFLDHCMAGLGRKNKMNKAQLAERLICAEVPFGSRTTANLAIYSELTDIFTKEISALPATFLPGHFKELMDTLSRQLHARPADVKLLATLKRRFIKNIQLHPAQALSALTAHPAGKQLLALLDGSIVRLLVKSANKNLAGLLQIIEKELQELKAGKKIKGPFEPVSRQIMAIALEVMIFHPGLSQPAFLEMLLEKCEAQLSGISPGEFELLCLSLLSGKSTNTAGIPVAAFMKMKERYAKNKEQTLSARIAYFLNVPGRQQEAGNMLRNEFTGRQFAQLRSSGNDESTALLNYFMDGGKQLMDQLVKECMTLLSAAAAGSEKERSFLLKELYWKCILDYKGHQGKKEMLVKMFKTAVVFHFPLAAGNQSISSPGRLSPQKRSHRLKDGNELSGADLASVFESCLTTGKTGIMQNGIEYRLDELMMIMQECYPSALRKVIAKISFSESPVMAENIITLLSGAERKGLLTALCGELITRQQVPAWAGDTGEEKAEELLAGLLAYSPVTFLQLLKKGRVTEAQLLWLSRSLSFNALCNAVTAFDPGRRNELNMLAGLYVSFVGLSAGSIPREELQHLLFRKLIKAWAGNNRRIVSAENIWKELAWDMCTRQNVPGKVFFREMEKIKLSFPPALQVSLEQLKPKENKTITTTMAIKKKIVPVLNKQDAASAAKTGIAVRNAGIVIINSYVQVLFERLGIMSDCKFKDVRAQEDAVHYLQYVATGMSSTEESLLPLNKLLCGLPLSHPVREGVVISEEHKVLIDGLIKAMIAHWPSVGDSSVNGFRGNWLVREGLLVEQDDKWELTVEKRAYDVLLNRSPFSFSIIKYSWMDKPLHVSWPY
ncbi:MAG: hypothetical protein JWO44_1336 [Bacteroidetes bacterium]|nr:hypothetical protein [Bacteroidota bacterium]